jgi:hypothetical protein
MITNIFRVIARSAFCDFILAERLLNFRPKNDLFDRAADQDISTSICRRYLFPCNILRERIFSEVSSFLGRNPAQPIKWVAF